MRTSAEGLERFRVAEMQQNHDWMEEAALMQSEALDAVGIAPTHRNLCLLRSTALRHPEIALYVRHNRNRDGNLAVGAVAPPMTLCTLEGQQAAWPPTDLAPGGLVVALCGSYS